MALNKHQIFAADDMRYAFVDVPEWGGQVRLKTMSIADQIEYDKIRDEGNSADIVIGMVLRCCVDDDGKRLFEEKDLEELHKKATGPIFKVFDAALDLNAIRQDAVEQEAKNS